MTENLNLLFYDVTVEDIEKELEHEQEMLDSGKQHYFRKVMEHKERGQASMTGGSRSVIGLLAPKLADLIVEEVTRLESGSVRRKPPELKSLKLLPPRDTAVLSMMALLDICAKSVGWRRENPTTQRAGFAIGNLIASEWMAREFKRNDAGKLKSIIKRNDERCASPEVRRADIVKNFKELDESFEDPLELAEKVRLGAFLLTAMEHLGIVYSKIYTRGKRAIKEYELSDELFLQIAAMDDLISELQPYFGPTLIQPRPWTSTRSGGYYLSFRKMNMVVARNSSNGINYAADEDMPEVFRAVNYLQNVPYKVNDKILDVVKTMRKANMTCSSLPRSDLEVIPPKPFDIDTNEEARRAWRVSAREVHERNINAKGKILAVMKTLSIAQRYVDKEKIYFPKCVDFRGRVYDLPMFLKPQGDDLSKGLLQFANGKPLGEDGGYWLAVHGANVWGEDKCSLDDRVAWVMNNEAKIFAAADAPFEERFWMDADKPFQFLAFCFEWAAAREVGTEYVSHIPVALDGSCNGLQHLSAILRDPIGGAAVNLLPADKPQDIYSEVLSKVVDELNVRSKRGEPTAQRWLPLMQRKTVKRNVMTLPYGATQTGFADQIMEDTLRPLQRQGLCPFSEPYTAARYLGDIIWDVTGQVVVAARVVMDWLQECAKIVSKSGLSVCWTSPSGFKVVQDYRKSNSRQVELQALGSRIRVRVYDGQADKLDTRKMSASIAPNFVHAMDAAHMINTVNLMTDVDKSLHFSMVHDSYATHATDAESLSILIRQSFVQMYMDRHWLLDFKTQIEDQTDLALPEVPPSGDLDVSQVINSMYFFA